MEIKVPSVGESVTEVTLAEWLVPVGAYVEVDQPLLLIESDKADMEIPAPASGVLVEQRIGPGEDANVGDVLGIFEPGEASASAEQVAPDPLTEPAETSTGHVMPAAARALHDAGMSATEVSASGPGGRILKEDVAAAKPAPAAESVAPPAATAPAPPATPPAPASAPSSTSTGTGEEQVVRMSRLRQTIATRLVCAQNEAALLTTFNEVDMSAVMDLRKRHQDAFVKRHGIKLGFMSFFIKAAIEALKEYPAVNAEIRGKEMVFKNYYDIGVAIGGGKGLVVPVLRSADALSMAGIEKAIAEFDWSLLRSLALRPVIRFAYFRRPFLFRNFANKEERIAKGLVAFNVAAETGWNNVEQDLRKYDVLPEQFFAKPIEYFALLRETILAAPASVQA